ncbi:uncharacterized phosphotransferase YvkC-like isoform X1 [Diorhabda sublineata]|uniref:uncharacterized phosphotransferase YvkC-like isoform X1 n=1 Tax=Diorhabda sublineata TaxID=1163346 RepID=UPI0024E060ED|nr:uncharacterized phosphotransferase YvkC-like isoform X1 [Diorhabda sublineata]
MECLFNLLFYTSLLCLPVLLYFLLFKTNSKSVYYQTDWFYLIKLIAAKKEIRKHQTKYKNRLKKLKERLETEIFSPNLESIDTQTFHGIDSDGNSLNFKLEIGIEKIAEASLHLRLKDGNTYVFPGEKGSVQTSLPKTAWKIAGLCIETLEPFRKLRITFNGLLKNISETGFEKIEHVQFNFIFTSFCSPHYFPQDIDTTMYANSLASCRWRDGSWKENIIPQYGFEQLGALKGFIKGDSYTENLILNIPGNRCRIKGISDRFSMKNTAKFLIIDEYGNIFNITVKCLIDNSIQFVYGFVLLSNDKKYPLSKVNYQMRHIGENKNFPDCIKTDVKANNKIYKIILHLNKRSLVSSCNNTKYGFEYYTMTADCIVNVNSGKAIVEFWYAQQGDEMFIPKPKLCDKKVDHLPEKLVTNIDEEESLILNLTGGKGNSLALLVSLNSSMFSVPEGFIVTVKAYNLHLSKNTELSNLVEALNRICCGKLDGHLKEACGKVVETFKRDSIHPNVRKEIDTQLEKYSKETEFFGWAVRSSAIGEDSEDLSAAGQNETFLACRNQTEILNKVLACWASLYTYQSVQYRWQHGLPVITEMAVVVQKMVKADSAGVLFTCHPSTSNPSQMVITSNFGLGETVVSGDSDPDTFILNRTWDGKVCVLEKILGSKNKVLEITSVGLEESVDNRNCKESWSISDKQAVELGKVGVLLEEAFGNPRDIEWAFYKNKLYLLQSRPITTLNGWSDFELSHEMDTPLRTKKAFFTTANIREVIPKATTVLSHSTSVRCTDWAIQKFAQVNFDPLSNKGIIIHQHNALIDITISIHKNVRSEVHVSGLILDLAIFGHPVLDKKIHEIIKNRFGIASPFVLLKDIYRVMKNSWYDIVSDAKKLVDRVELKLKKTDDVPGIYKNINDSLINLGEVAVCHTKTSAVSVFYQIIAMNIMLEGKSDLTTEHISDFACILSSCEDVISAEIPKYLEDIAKIINQEEYSDEFLNLRPRDGVEFLKNHVNKAYYLFNEFMDKHGHRSLHEFEIMEPSWRENPDLIISMIQANVKNQRTTKKDTKNLQDIVNNLKSIKRKSTRSLIKFLIQRIRVAVGCREQTKSEMIRGYDKLRQAYRLLGKTMVLEGLLPSENLIYHLTHEEIGSIINKRNPTLITKAIRRQKLYPIWKKLEFPEIMPEVPKPEEDNSKILVENLTELCKGTPVCTGIVRGRACVIKSLDEINQLNTGDILITYSTDIGWSPYFPMLLGIVTELGGLVSHGAVVAREYGLPCIVGVQNATKHFKTGDMVQLDGNRGELGKI